MNTRGKITFLLVIFALCSAGALMSAYLQNKRESSIRPADLYAVVNNQLTELRAANFSRAYDHASAEVQQRLNIEQFADMVRRDYARIVRAKHIEFGFVERHGRHAIIQVFFVDDTGQVTPCIYSLVNEGETWKIEGARFLQRWPAGARLGGMRS